jgi:hypothetical protein
MLVVRVDGPVDVHQISNISPEDQNTSSKGFRALATKWSVRNAYPVTFLKVHTQSFDALVATCQCAIEWRWNIDERKFALNSCKIVVW